MNGKINLKKIIGGLLIFSVIVSVVNFLLTEGLFFKEVIYWINNRYSEAVLPRLGISVFIASVFLLLFVSSPVKVNVGFINIDNADLRNFLKPFLPTYFLLAFAVLSSATFFLFPPNCKSPLLSVKLYYENSTQVLQLGDEISLPYDQSARLEAVTSDNSILEKCNWSSSNSGLSFSHSDQCQTNVTNRLSAINDENIIISLEARNTCGAYSTFPVLIQP